MSSKKHEGGRSLPTNKNGATQTSSCHMLTVLMMFNDVFNSTSDGELWG